jgi:hypothetical protein
MEVLGDYIMPTLTQRRLKEVVHYNPDTGIFTRIDRGINSKPLGSKHSDENGYLKFSIDGTLYFAHRLAWLYFYGDWPNGLVDHSNRKKSDNRIVNLRDSNKSKNGHNANVSKRSKTGFTGVTFVKNTKRYRSCFVKDRKRIHLGYFDTPEKAHEAYLIAKQKASLV